MIEDSDWSKLVRETYGKPYSFLMQQEKKARGIFEFPVPCEDWMQALEDFHDEIPLDRLTDKVGVPFEKWLNTAPQEHKDKTGWNDDTVESFWEHNFYPDIYAVVTDLHKRGLITAGNYGINIDW